MGLGKTLQSISILAYHWEYLRIQGPHLICVPKSTLSNWMNELKRWCPSLRAIRFHGSKEDREYMVEELFNSKAASHDGKRPDKPQIMDEHGELIDDNSDNPRQWDVCVTTYEMCNTERKTLQKFAWKYLVIDEGKPRNKVVIFDSYCLYPHPTHIPIIFSLHNPFSCFPFCILYENNVTTAHRLKNDASMFSTTVRSFSTANRLLLTGTPLQNNLHELWALLNFLLPDIFSSADQFDEWFNLEIDDEDSKKNMISQLHKILRPFMLRRLKADVAKGLPPKTETIVMVGMSKMQKQLYKKLLLRDLDAFTGNQSKNRTAVLNIVMQLRKCCGHPYLFEGVEDRTMDPLGEHLVQNCGKLFMVDKLLKRLKERDSRVLIFTQMTRVLDILEDFMVMRGYKYCRIDGNTTHEDREQGIDTFNEPNSEKFCFILSTRAGGLGINLQTADVCILYDSDWNPQQDLQAQDRCHRLGQKKPVSVYRLVSENTVEEKIVERAQQKLKLDAMVVQQGRLKDKDKVSKEEIMAAVQFGADKVFRSEESTITDEDIDVILARGAAKTKELSEKISNAEKGDMLDFRLDGGVSAQTFEGIDYSDRELREQLRLLAANSMGKRERRAPPAEYNPIMHTKKTMTVNNVKIKLPKTLRLPSMEDHQFYNRERLLELGKLEFETYATLRMAGKLPARNYIERVRSLLPDELSEEKCELLDEGFGKWSRSQFFHFVKSNAKHGRDDIASIAQDMDMGTEEVKPYSVAFWTFGPTELKDEWERFTNMIERGEKKLEKQKKLTQMLKKFVCTFDDPRRNLVFANKGTTHFALEQDRALLCAVDAGGYGNWETVRENIRQDKKLKFQHSVQGMTTAMITKRADYRIRQVERELESREKALEKLRPVAVIAAQKSLDAIKAMEKYEVDARTNELQGEVPPKFDNFDADTKTIMEERKKEGNSCVGRLREIEGQVSRCLLLADETRQGIIRGDQYVNFSNINLKGGTTFTTAGGEHHFEVLPELESGAIEARINRSILSIEECGQCENCINKGRGVRKLCMRRLEERRRLIRNETKAVLKARGKSTSHMKPGMITTSKIIPKKKPPPPPPKPPPKPAPTSNGSNGKKRKIDTKDTDQFPKAKKAKVASAAPKKKIPKMMMTSNGMRPRITSQGNKRMSIPDEAFPDFCRRIGPFGTGERMKLINQFAEEHPETSIRQITLKLGEITCKEPPECVDMTGRKVRAFMFYLRPRYYKFLYPEDRPEDWERYAEEDDLLWENEKEEERLKKEMAKQQKSQKPSNGEADAEAVDGESVASDRLETASNVSPSVTGDGDGDSDGDETEDDEQGSEPAVKKLSIAGLLED
jgi:SWI/SNF-related matrix-associated actin-dependent regulator of chromatin subfamily A member 5